MIASFGDATTEDVFNGKNSARARGIAKELLERVIRKLDMINAAYKLDDLKAPPGNRLEALKGDLAGFHSIRVNDQWRIIFRWVGTGVSADVRLIEYHR
ncbi:MAG TPA: type II toxin-antitoxin system RelE/ParE family toxin [Thermoanaerobaculia bacterium]